MSDTEHQQYDDELVTVLETVWGEGFLSPGGPDEVDRILEGLDIAGAKLLDIGCGVGGVDFHLVTAHRAGHVVGIDIDADLIARCQARSESRGLSDRLSFEKVEPGPLPFEPGCFDLVFSKDSIIHIPDKEALCRDIFRGPKPGGRFAASDWLAGYEGKPSPEMKQYLEVEGLDFWPGSAARFERALKRAGFFEVTAIDRNAWYLEIARAEHQRLAGELYDYLVKSVGKAFTDRQVDVWNKVVIALENGDLRPTHLRGLKPG